ncbi:MAG: UDP-N-acetylmuramate dehydrogenase [Planctomycetes bacterium]|nr:UDP-N-acetylmuramate dehydrogenase [Planctomycetota bacterium]MCB9829792.1 UDP-N-acetylmuramate dehydrogenase [Planctomycetota bacterium]
MGSPRASDTANPPLAGRTSLRVGGVAESFHEPSVAAEIGPLLADLHARGVPVHVLGGGYNLLVGDGVLPGAVLSTRRLKGVDVRDDVVVAEAGASFPRLVESAAEWGIPALSGCPGIPGTVGGVVRMNAGGRHGNVGDALVRVRGFRMDGTPFDREIAPGDLGYRTTVFADTVVTEAWFRRVPDLDVEAERALLAEAWAWKRASQPLRSASAGCIFRNPDGPGGTRSAGRLVDEAGLKGLRVGDAMVSDVHANFIVNLGGATAADVHALIAEVQRRVLAFHGVRLELEVEVWPTQADDVRS